MPPQLWRNRSLVAGLVVMLSATGILVATFFLNSLYLPGVQGSSALRVGLEFLPLALVIGAGAHLAGRMLPRAGSRLLIVAGLALMGGGALLLTTVSAQSGYLTGVLPGLLVIGAGAGLVLPSAAVTAMSGIADQHAGLTSGLLTAAHEIGAALGLVVFSAGLALTAAAAAPAVRPAAGTKVAVH